MMTSKPSTRTSYPGLTIIELLVVVTVVGILAGISLVGYDGMQKRSRSAEAETAGLSVHNKAKTAYSAASRYPTAIDGTNSFNSRPETSLAGSGISLASITDKPDKPQTVSYQACETGARIGWWDYTKNTLVERSLGETCDSYTQIVGSP